MSLTLKQITKDISKINSNDILSCWRWRLTDIKIKSVILVSCLGDLFLSDKIGCVYWLQTDTGDLTKVADTLQQFQNSLSVQENLDNWFASFVIEELLSAGLILKDNQVYSYKKPPILGGEYSTKNIEITDISVHFAFTGQICEQVHGLPDGTSVKNINFKIVK